MISNKKASSYLLYAIGEVFLVVIGILIAVSINDWNEQIKTQNKEESYLQRLKEEALWNIDVLNMQIELYENRASNLDSLATMISRGAPKNNSLEISVAPYFISAWRIRNSAYEELVSTGTLGILKDEKLREMLDEVASFHTITIQTLNYWRDLSAADVSLFQPYREKHVTITDIDTTQEMSLNYERMIGQPEVIAGLYYWSNANYKFAGGISEFRDMYVNILEQINCLATKTCLN